MSTKLSDLNAAQGDLPPRSAIFSIRGGSPNRRRPRGVRGRTALSAAMKDVVDRATEMQLTLIKGHPDLANKNRRAKGLTADPIPNRTAPA
jgi:hypothetical protein